MAYSSVAGIPPCHALCGSINPEGLTGAKLPLWAAQPHVTSSLFLYRSRCPSASKPAPIYRYDRFETRGTARIVKSWQRVSVVSSDESPRSFVFTREFIIRLRYRVLVNLSLSFGKCSLFQNLWIFDIFNISTVLNFWKGLLGLFRTLELVQLILRIIRILFEFK